MSRGWYVDPQDRPTRAELERDEVEACVECGNDLACAGYPYCSECLEAGVSEANELEAEEERNAAT